MEKESGISVRRFGNIIHLITGGDITRNTGLNIRTSTYKGVRRVRERIAQILRVLFHVYEMGFLEISSSQ